MVRHNTLLFVIFCFFSVGSVPLFAQEAPKADDAKAASADKQDTPKEEKSITKHNIKINGKSISYEATYGSLIIKDDKDEPTGLIFYSSYVRSDTKSQKNRPIAFLYNGGPGSSSAWLHMGAFGPRRIVTSDPAFTPPAPYRLSDNSYSLLDKTDMVFIDPVGTGFSRAVGKGKGKDFWGIDEDAHSIAQFIYTFVGRNQRWNSPKFLIGESYGTFRSAVLGKYLQENKGMAINGIVLVSSVLDMASIGFPIGDDRSYIFFLPSYAATARYHKQLSNASSDLSTFLDEVRTFASGEYANALFKGTRLSASAKTAIAEKLSAYTGLSQDYWIKADLRVNLPQFQAELKRSLGETTGRLDARYLGYTYDLLTETAEGDPQSNAVTGAFTAALNAYVRQELKYNPDREYNLLSLEVNSGWDWKRAGDVASAPNVMGDLAAAIVYNPNLKVEVESGYYDMATPFFATDFTMNHLELPAKLQGNIKTNFYEAGHMMYLNEPSLAALKSNIGKFIDDASHKAP